ncbi:hypothetical protein LCGC14_0443320, partial [marine sediment metagenome]
TPLHRSLMRALNAHSPRDVNVVFGAGLADDAADGFLVKAA